LEQGGFPSYDNWLKDLGDWTVPLKEFLDEGKLQKTYDTIKKEYNSHTVFPPPKDIFTAFKRVPYSKVKAVIVGQDPYFNKGEAMGLSFSVPKDVKVPGSLKNIYKALENDNKVKFKRPSPLHGDLTKWANQNVLLLNVVLTVREKKANSHKGLGWEQFTEAVISAIGKKKSGVVFFLWGKFAQGKKKFIDGSKNLILEYAHPSPLSASSGADFSKCKNFSQANEYLISKGNDPINWNVD